MQPQANTDRTFLAHAADLLARAERGEVTYTAYLTPLRQKQLLGALGAREEFYFFGGYAAAERKRLFFLPPYLVQAEEELRRECLAPYLAESLVALEIAGSGFRALSHRDYLGAVMHLGIERDALGDLCVMGEHRAVLFCDSVMHRFLCENLTRVANDAVKLRVLTLPPDFDGGRQFRAISDTVASPRADSVVAALANLSRERAQALFREGLVEIDYEPADKPDRPLEAGTVIVIRGKGKFILRSLSQQTKKGRIRLLADQYL